MITFKSKFIIEDLCNAIIEDEYVDSEQKLGETDVFPNALIKFVRRNLSDVSLPILEVGCGCGASFEYFLISNAIEPNTSKFEIAKKNVEGKRDIKVEQAFAEGMPFDNNYFNAIIMLNSFFQTRSDFEAITQFNRVLKMGGRVIINTYDDTNDIVFGRVYGFNNLIRMFEDFGFAVVEKRKHYINVDGDNRFLNPYYMYMYCFEKVRNFEPKELRKMQIVKKDDKFKVKNFFPESRDWRLI